MDFLNQVFSENQVFAWETRIADWFFYASILFLLFELVRLLVRKSLNWQVIGDTVTNFVTFFAFFISNILVLGIFYVGAYYLIYEYLSIARIPITPWSIALCVVAADFAYYWEHRFTHRVGFGWATHTVHHSSPYFNISVAYRFGPIDGIIPLFFHAPLALIGFHPLLIVFSETMVQIYQTALHTEVIGKLPKPVEAVMNTPSHHRVHHGSNPQYHDKNYAGMFIVWDRLFGTFEEEREKVVYGITKPLNSVNPITVFFHGFARLFRQIAGARDIRSAFGFLLRPPGWTPDPRA
ncbi:MAG: sterol desaturase family protein [Gammaproteobacteria bacterium]|nr:sterol desaturase family protein [Gammaproteobacteria bacterium]MYF57682.1 sterol desaturase family protein [Gammaproteobacteria bacterium]